MRDARKKAAAVPDPFSAEADPVSASAAVAIRLLVSFYSRAETSGSLPSDAARLVTRLRQLPDRSLGHVAWARALSSAHSSCAPRSDREIESHSSELSLALRAVQWARDASGGFKRDSEGREWVTRRHGDKPRGQDYRNLILATFYAGLAAALVSRMTPTDVDKEIRSQFAKLGAAANLKRDPRQLAKREIRECWENWQAGRELHKSQAAFARAMCLRFDVITSPASVERWARCWSAERKGGTS